MRLHLLRIMSSMSAAPPVDDMIDAPGVDYRVVLNGNYLFGDIEGKLDVLRVESTRCPRKGRYSVRKLIEKFGRKANMIKWRELLSGDCLKRDAPQLHDRCDLICPDLPNVI